MKRLLLVAVMVVVTLVGMVGVSGAQTSSAISNAAQEFWRTPKYDSPYDSPAGMMAKDAQEFWRTPKYDSPYDSPAKPKMYYLTVTSFTGGDAITACDSGFHMASISEIQDPSNLQYTVYYSIVALVDSPSFDQASDRFPDHTGWVRTEADSLTGLVNNCDVGMSSSDQQSGTTMTRRSLWGENNGHSLYEESDPAAWWQSTQTASCSQPEPVWCVENPDYGAVTELPATVCTGRIDQLEGGCI
jgi:hypothetical protein